MRALSKHYWAPERRKPTPRLQINREFRFSKLGCSDAVFDYIFKLRRVKNPWNDIKHDYAVVI